MPRTLAAAVSTAVAAETGELVHLIQLELSGGTIRMSTGATDLSWDSQTWEAVGGALAFDAITESSDLSAGAMALTLSGVDQAVLGALLGQGYLGRAAKVWRAHLSPSAGTVVADPVLLFTGFMNGGWTCVERRGENGQPGTVEITLRCADRLAEIELRRGFQTNVGSHQAIYPGDKFFQYVEQLRHQRIVWTAG